MCKKQVLFYFFYFGWCCFLAGQNRISDSTLIIPVVVHIIHTNGSENISDDQVKNAIRWINDGLQHQNHYTGENGAVGNIQLCLAQQDPSGIVTNGIVRYLSDYTDMTLDHGFDSIVKLATWDTKKYLNIRLVKTVCNVSECNLGGFAFLPNAHGLKKDGIYLAAQSFGLDADRTVTTIHELGHYLGLYHTFEKGCKNDNCLVDGDRVCDTPPQGSVLGLCSSGAVNSCTSDEDDSSINNPFRSQVLGGLGDQADDKSNFMDYSDLSCQKYFTQGQVDKMRSFLQNERASLLASPACTPPCNAAVEANFVLNDTLIEFGTLPTINNTSTNAASFVWLLNGNMMGTGTDPLFSNLAPGYYLLTLIAKSSQSECPPDTSSQSFRVVCTVDAAHAFYVQDSTLFVEYDANLYFNTSYLLNTFGDTLFDGKLDSLVLSPGGYLLCSLFSNGQCKDSICNWIQIMNPNGTEICNDGLDNDLDGFVDIFDKDCSCNDQIFNGLCDSDCQYLPDSFPPIEARVKWRSGKINEGFFSSHILTGDLLQFESGSEIIISGNKSGVFPNIRDTSYLIILSGEDGSVLNRLSFGNRSLRNFCRSPFIFKTPENKPNLVVYDLDSIYFLNENLNFILEEKYNNNILNTTSFFNSSDINYDGQIEIYSGTQIFNSKGILIYDGGFGGCNSINMSNQCFGSHSIVGDFLDVVGLELAAGNKVFSFQINNYNGTAGNTSNITMAEAGVEDGSTSMGDIDGDGKLDVIVLRNGINPAETGLWAWNPRTGTIIAHAFTEGRGGGIPFVGDIDGDCLPEIGISYVNKLVLYRYDGTKNLKKVFTKVITENVGVIGLTMFDLNQDGRQEIVFRDETQFTILDGPTGNTIFTYPIFSTTSFEHPIIADIDHDGAAEILVEGGSSKNDTTYVFCFESANIPWAPARSVWNQAGYHITNVNDDLTIPRQQQNNAAFFDTDSCAQTTCNQPYNTFMCQATYRTQDGCVKWPAVDLSVDALDYRCTPDSLYITLEVRNQSDNDMKHDSLRLGIYDQDQNAPLQTLNIGLPRDMEGKIVNSDTITIAVANDKADRWQLRFLVNIPDSNTNFTQNIKGLTAVLECDYFNNTDSIVLDLAIKTLDLGPDLTKCRTAVVTLEAPADFVSYVWSDGSINSSYTSSIPGTHYLTATDVCNRVYRDSVTFTINPILSPQLGGDTLVCEDDLLTFGLPSDFDWVRWLPSEVVSCDTCHTTTLYADTATQLIVLGSRAGCIDVDTVEITIQPLKIFREMLTICKGDSVLFNQSYVSQEGSYEYRIGNCDSLITLELKVLAPDSIKLPRQTICEGDSAYFLGKWWKEELNSTVKLKNQYACDSFITFELRVIDTIHTTRTSQICEGDSLFVNGYWLKTEGSYPYYFTSLQGCDSIEEVRLTVIPSYHQSETASICAGDSIQQWGTWFASEGTYSQTFTTSMGCDSTMSLVLTVEPLVMAQRSYEICEGSKLTLNGVEYTTAGNYTLHLPAEIGCDTLLNFELRISALVHKTEEYRLCDGDSVFINNEWVTGNDTVVYNTFENGCPTEVTARVLSLAPQTSSFTTILCPEDSILINGQWVRGNTNFSYTLTGTAGCDSVVTASITSLAWPPAPVINLDCESAAYEAVISLEAPWHVSWSNGDTSTSTAITTMPASATVQYDNRCLRTYDLLVGSLPDLQSLPGFDDQNITAGEGLPLTVNLDPGMWKIKWSPAAIVSCDTCFSITVIADRNATITLEMTHISGCTYTRSFGIVVESLPVSIAIPNVFTPGTAGSNSEWHIFLPEGYTVLDVAIYDRWGSKVYQTVNATPAWDGTFNGKDLLPGVYIYTLKYQDPYGIAHFLKGDITIVR
ncbi:MAG: gliding motility-associated C-terminal domain-containing protein [Saprospiraceae bacterium]|nr:gliding motility-associated C-terminal domain-containing protein [Saprospiraceae bacterium]